MSFSYYNQRKKEGYSSDFPAGIFSTKKNILSPSFYHFLYQITQFNKKAKQDLHGMEENLTILDYLKQRGFTQRLIDEYVIPMGAAIWSTSQNDTYQFPAKSFIQFWDNHCLLQILDRPKWRTIAGGSQNYIDAVVKKINLKYVLNHPIKTIKRDGQTVTICGPHGQQEYDAVVIATHADQAFKMLETPTELESAILGQWKYSKNKTILHTSTAGLPPNQAGWASWIYSRDNDNTMSASYWMNRLQSLSSKKNYFVTLNPSQDIQINSQEYSTEYEHPMMTKLAVNTQKKLPELNGNQNTYFCGSYFGNGFSRRWHCVCRKGRKGSRMSFVDSKVCKGTTSHTRFSPIKRTFNYGLSYIFNQP